MTLESNEENNPAHTSQDKSADQATEGNVGPSSIRNPPNPPQSPSSDDHSEDYSKPWWKDRRFKLELAGFIVLFAYTIFSGLQWWHIRWANNMTREAINGNNSSLQQTLDRMTWQIQETHEIAKQALAQAQQTAKISVDTHDLAVQAKNQADTTRDIAQTSRDALISVQRAFVFVTDLDAIRVADPQDASKVAYLEFSIGFANNGTTPTSHMRVHYSWLRTKEPLPDNFTYPDLGDSKSSPIALGPKGVGHTTPIPVSADIISEIISHQSHFYIWGWIRYRDIFPKTKPHITRFCTEITGFDGNPLSGNPAALSRPLSSNCPNNCYDDECKIQ